MRPPARRVAQQQQTRPRRVLFDTTCLTRARLSWPGVHRWQEDRLLQARGKFARGRPPCVRPTVLTRVSPLAAARRGRGRGGGPGRRGRARAARAVGRRVGRRRVIALDRLLRCCQNPPPRPTNVSCASLLAKLYPRRDVKRPAVAGCDRVRGLIAVYFPASPLLLTVPHVPSNTN